MRILKSKKWLLVLLGIGAVILTALGVSACAKTKKSQNNSSDAPIKESVLFDTYADTTYGTNGVWIEKVYDAAVDEEGHLAIPETYQGQTVVGIRVLDTGEPFKFNENVKSVSLPNSLIEIGYNAFRGMIRLHSVTFAENSCLKKVDADAFKDCASLQEVIFPDSLEYLNDVFSGCTLLQSVHFGANTEMIADYFTDCPYLSVISVSEENQTYSSLDGVLYSKDKWELIRCPRGIKTLNLPQETEEIGVKAVYHNENLTTVDLKNVAYIREYAFEGCKNLYGVEGNDVDIVMLDAFKDTPWILKTNTPNGILRLGWALVKYRGAELTLTLEDYHSISPYAFEGNDTLYTVYLKGSLFGAYEGAFKRCQQLRAVYVEVNGPLFISDGTFDENLPDRKIYMSQGAYDYAQTNVFWQKYVQEGAVILRDWVLQGT